MKHLLLVALLATACGPATESEPEYTWHPADCSKLVPSVWSCTDEVDNTCMQYVTKYRINVNDKSSDNQLAWLESSNGQGLWDDSGANLEKDCVGTFKGEGDPLFVERTIQFDKQVASGISVYTLNPGKHNQCWAQVLTDCVRASE